MTLPRDQKPVDWSPIQPLVDAGEDVYFYVGIETTQGGRAEHVIVWHWHTPTDLPPRWQASYCGLHTVVQLTPLTLVNSLACEDGCTWHGYITDGVWRSV